MSFDVNAFRPVLQPDAPLQRRVSASAQATSQPAVAQTAHASVSQGFLALVKDSFSAKETLYVKTADVVDAGLASRLDSAFSTDLRVTAPKFISQLQADVHPADWDMMPEAVQGQTSSLPAAVFPPDLAVATSEDAEHFIEHQQQGPLTGLAVEADHVLVATGTHMIKMAMADVETAIKGGKLAADSPLARALVVHEAASASGLKGGAVKAIMRAFTTAVAAGTSPQVAHQEALASIRAAVAVETYVNHDDGLALDLAKVGTFTQDAFNSLHAGGDLAAARNRTVDLVPVREQQGVLTSSLHAFSEAFATARATGDYSQAFDQLQSFVSVSGKVGTTDYWRSRPDTIGDAMTPPSLIPSAAPLADSLGITEFAGMARQIAIPHSPVAVTGSFFSNLKARVLDFFGKAPEATTGHVAPQAAAKLLDRVARFADVAFTGEVYKAPPKPAPIVSPTPEIVPPTPTAPPPRMGVPSAAPKLGKLDVEGNIRQWLEGMKAGEVRNVATGAEIGVGIEFNVMDYVPVAGDYLKAVVEIKASIGASGGSRTEREVTRLDDGRMQVTITEATYGKLSAAAKASLKVLPLGVGASADGTLTLRSTLTFTFASAADAATFLAPRPFSDSGLTAGPATGPKTFVLATKVETLMGTSVATEVTGFVSPSNKSSATGFAAKLPGVRTTVSTDSSAVASPVGGNGPDVHELDYTVRTHSGKSADAVISSEVRVTGKKRIDATGAPVFDKPAVALSLNILKLQGLTKVGAEGDRAREILVDKYTERLTEAVASGNAKGFDGQIDTSTIRTQVDSALRLIQAQADVIFGGEGVQQQSTMGKFLTYTKGDVAKLEFSLEPGAQGKLHLSNPKMVVEGTKRLDLKIEVEKVVQVKLNATAGLTRQREVEAQVIHQPVFPRTAPVVGTEVSVTSSKGRLYAVQTPDGNGGTTLSEPAVSVALSGQQLLQYLIRDDGGSRDGVIEQARFGLERVVGKTNEEHGIDLPIDWGKCAQTMRDVAEVLRHDYQALKAGQAKDNFTVTYEDFAVHLTQSAIPLSDVDVLLDFKLDKGSDGKYSLRSPLASAKNVDTVRRKESTVSPDLLVEEKNVGFLQARTGDAGLPVPVFGLHAKVDDMLATFDSVTDTAGKPDVAKGIEKWADDMQAKLDSYLQPAMQKGKFTGKFDPVQTRATLVKVGQSLAGMRQDLTHLWAKDSLSAEGVCSKLTVVPREGLFSSGHKLMLEFEAVQDPQDPTRWQLPEGGFVAPVVQLAATTDPEVSPDLKVEVAHEGFFRAEKATDGTVTTTLGLHAKVDDVFKLIDPPPPRPGTTLDPEAGLQAWADQMVTKLDKTLVQPARKAGTFNSRFDVHQMRETLMTVGRSMLAQQTDIRSLPQGASKTLTGPGVALKIVPRESGTGHKMTLTFTPEKAPTDPSQWRLPEGRFA